MEGEKMRQDWKNTNQTTDPEPIWKPSQYGTYTGRGLSEDLRPTFAEDRESLRCGLLAGRPTPVLAWAASPITGSAARPSTGLQTGLDIMSYDIQIFHVLVTPG
ncbi:unnamed protein product [Arctogadus glacialis]